MSSKLPSNPPRRAVPKFRVFLLGKYWNFRAVQQLQSQLWISHFWVEFFFFGGAAENEELIFFPPKNPPGSELSVTFPKIFMATKII